MGAFVDHGGPARKDILHPPLAVGRDLRRWRRPRQKTVEVRGCSSAQHRALPSRANCRHVGRLGAGRTVSDPVDAEVLPNERTGADAVADLRLGHARVEQLPTGHDAVRATRKPRDHSVGGGTWRSHCNREVPLPSVSPPGGAGYWRTMDQPPGDSRSIENPDAEEAMEIPAEEPVRGETADDVGEEGESVSEPGEGLVTEEGVNEPGTKP